MALHIISICSHASTRVDSTTDPLQPAPGSQPVRFVDDPPACSPVRFVVDPPAPACAPLLYRCASLSTLYRPTLLTTCFSSTRALRCRPACLLARSLRCRPACLLARSLRCRPAGACLCPASLPVGFFVDSLSTRLPACTRGS
jgi:hypothetical protein